MNAEAMRTREKKINRVFLSHVEVSVEIHYGVVASDGARPDQQRLTSPSLTLQGTRGKARLFTLISRLSATRTVPCKDPNEEKRKSKENKGQVRGKQGKKGKNKGKKEKKEKKKRRRKSREEKGKN